MTTHEGWLIKKGSVMWNRRYCKVDGSGNFSYFVYVNDKKPKGQFSVKDAQIAEAQSAHKKFKFCFQISVGKKTYFHCCEKKEELDHWIKVLVANGAKESSELYRRSRIAEDGSIKTNEPPSKQASNNNTQTTTQPATQTTTQPASQTSPAQQVATQSGAESEKSEAQLQTQSSQPVENTSTTSATQTTQPAQTTQPTQEPANANTNANSNSNSQSKEEVKRPSDAAKFLKRSRHKFEFSSKLSSEQLEDFKKLFSFYDKDGSGTINIRELDEALLKLGFNFTPENVLTITRIVDENKDGVLNFEEFLGLYDFLDFLKNLFKTADKDNSGKLDRKEVNVLLHRSGYKFTPEQTELLYRMCDEDGSDTIELEDFLSLILFIFWAQILFATTDTDGNDMVDFGEFNTLLEDLGIFMEPEGVQKFFKELDTDNSGNLSFEEYIELVFELRFPLISDLVRLDIKRTGVSDDLKEKVEVKPDEKINLMEASGFLKRSRHRFNFDSKLTEDQKGTFRELFKLYDKDNSGTINIRELANVLDQLGYKFSPENIETIMFIVDDNLDGVLNFNEFLGFYDFLEYLKTLFESADIDKDGKIDRAELAKLLTNAGYKFSDKQLELFYKMCDSDGSGVLEVYDFFELTLFIFWAQILFAKADTDGNDKIDVKEFNNNLKRLGIPMDPEGTVKYFTELDVDKDGFLHFEEYIELVFMLKFLELIFG